MDINVTKKLFWSFTTDQTLKVLKTKKEGLSEQEAKKRLKEVGPNELKEHKRITKLRIFINQFKSPLIFILVIAGTITLFLQDYIDSSVIFLAVIVNAALGFYQENKAENTLEHLRTYIKEEARVFRNGKEREISAKELVPGDIIHLTSGTRISADARLIEVTSLTVDEAILTGESLPVSKNLELFSKELSLADRKNMVYAGTFVIGGSGIAVITSTAQLTELGKIAQLVVGTKRQKTPLQRSVDKMAWIIAMALSFVISLVFAIGVWRGHSILEMFLISVAMAVSAIPESLPIALTVILAVGVDRLAKRKGVVRKLSAAEALGSTTIILTDKTGTLTEANLKLVSVIDYNNLLKNKISKVSTLTQEQKNILKIGLLNVDILIENPKDAINKWRISGDPLEQNMAISTAERGIFITDLHSEFRPSSILPFNSKNKFSVFFAHKSDKISVDSIKNKNFLSILGAPDILLEKSNIKEEEFLKINEIINNLANSGMRIVGVAVKPLNDDTEVERIDLEKLNGLKFLGIIAFHDPIRKEVPDAIKKVEAFGVRVIMVTGDLKGTAISIARDLGWDIADREVIVGAEMKNMSDEQLMSKLKHVKIFARVSPEDKMRIAILYKQSGETVAMTGDGVNDAPSLKVADIGIAVGSGTDVTKDVADLVLLDDNFTTIVAAIEEGRRILSNIRKSTIYLLADALDEVFLIGGSLLVGLPLPLNALQILWVNFFSDSFPALAFASEKNFDDINKASVIKKTHIWDSEVKFLILGIGTITSLLLFFMYWFLLNQGHDEQTVKSFIFFSFGIYTLFFAFPLRNLSKSIFRYNFFSNKLLIAGVSFGIILMVVAIYVPFFQNILKTTPLSLPWVALLIFWVIINIAAVELTKWVYRKRSGGQ